MTPRFIGDLDWAPQNLRDPDFWQLEHLMGQVTSDSRLVICQTGKRVNGASIPSWLWPLFGHPFKGDNKFWSTPHDMGFNGYAVVLDLTKTDIDIDELVKMPNDQQWEMLDLLFKTAADLPTITCEALGRRWWNSKLLEAMHICEESRFRCFCIYSGVSIGSKRPWDGLHDAWAHRYI